jgi:hypothetical protein
MIDSKKKIKAVGIADYSGKVRTSMVSTTCPLAESSFYY